MDESRSGGVFWCKKPHDTKKDGRRIPPAVFRGAQALTYLARVEGFTRVAVTVRVTPPKLPLKVMT